MNKQFTQEEQALFDAHLQTAMAATDHHEAEQSFCYCDGMLGFALVRCIISSDTFKAMQRTVAAHRANRRLQGVAA